MGVAAASEPKALADGGPPAGSARAVVVATALLALLALLGNVLNLPMVYGVSLIFGSVATVMALRLLGVVPALFVALVGGAYTVQLWGHPYALLAQLAELAVLALLQRRGWRNLVLADLAYWVFIGAPLVALFYRWRLGMEWLPVAMVTAKQALNGVFNTLVAVNVLLGLQLFTRYTRRWSPAPPRLADLLFSSLLTSILVAGAAPVIVHSHAMLAELETTLQARMREQAYELVAAVRPQDRADASAWQQAMAGLRASEGLGLALLDKQGRVLHRAGELASLDAARQGQLQSVRDGLHIWLPAGSMAAMARWARGRYLIDIELAPPPPVLADDDTVPQRLRIERPARPLVLQTEARTLHTFALLGALLLLATLGSALLSHWLAKPLAQLAAESSNLAERLAQGREIQLPVSPVQEYGRLGRTLDEMARHLAEAFRELRGTQAGLEAQVRTRTAELAQLKSTLDRTLDGVFIFESDSLRFIYANEGAQRMTGYSHAELMGMLPVALQAEVDEARFRRRIAPLRAQLQDAQTFITALRHRDGRRVPVEVLIQHVAPQGETARFVAVVRDITERQRVDRMKSEFVSTVSHELRTPLTSISGALGLVASGTLGELPPAARQMVAIAQRNSQRLGALINDLLDMERLATGRMQFELRDQALDPLVEQSLDQVQSYGGGRRVRLALTRQLQGARVKVDAQRLLQVMANLLSNAIKFSPDDASVDVEISQRGGWVRVAVQDRGEGIPEEFRPRLFEKFAQADASDTRRLGGSGLGLAISKELVEGMGGRIGYDSVLGEGSCFFFELPLLDAQRTAAAAEPSAPPAVVADSGLPSVLHVDADDALHAVVREISSGRFALAQARSIAQARELLALQPFAAVVLDPGLPDGDGSCLLSEIRDKQPEACVLLLSGQAPDAALQLKVDGALLKSQASPRALLDALARACERVGVSRQGG